MEQLNDSTNLTEDVLAIAEGINSTTLQQLMRDPRTTYPVLRALDALPHNSVNGGGTNGARRVIDIDEVVLRNERYIRSRGGSENGDGKYLVGLRALAAISALEVSSKSNTLGLGGRSKNESLVFTRKDPPKGGLEFLDQCRGRVLQIQPNDDAYITTFETLTKGALRRLDWSNALVAGGMALTTLTHVNASKNKQLSNNIWNIDVYLYGLSPEQANRKVEKMYDVWKSNCPGNVQKLVVKNPKTIVFTAGHQHISIRVILQLLPSPTDILLKFDLDPCAVAFNGSQVFMLPRCARALETGYSAFTMNLIWGHYPGDRQATQMLRVFNYADRGFGLRILPSYAQSLQEENLQRQWIVDGARNENAVGRTLLQPGSAERDRKPFGINEPGLRTLKRVAYLGQDYVHRFYFGSTPLAIYPNRPSNPSRREEELGLIGSLSDYGEYWIKEANWQNEDDWNAELARIEQVNLDMKRQAKAGQDPCVPLIWLHELDTRDMQRDSPDVRQGLGNFELFMRHCEAWELNARREARYIIFF